MESHTCPRKLILKCGLSPGDIVMLTAAVRELHRAHPGEFLTDVQTSCLELWEHNPDLTPLDEADPEATLLDCEYPLINRCNRTPYHCLHGFIEFFNDRLGLKLKPTEFKGFIPLSAQEKHWHSQVREITGTDLPFWIIAGGGKQDVTIKWWSTKRFQAVVDHFKGRIQFVQVGEIGHWHPRLNGVIDLRGQTRLRELVRLVYHAQGILCPVTALMHLAAAVETKPGQPSLRPCVIIAGAREPAHWEAYPGHQFIHTNGAVPCGGTGGCWKDRTFPLRDGDRRDAAANLCVNVVADLPRCMDLITPAVVIERIESYFKGGVVHYLSARQRKAAERAVAATRDNPFDLVPLNLHFAGLACDRFIQNLPAYPAHRFAGRGIVLCGGGLTYFTNAWVCIRLLRARGCNLPIQLWHLGRREMTREMIDLLEPLGVECRDAGRMRKQFPVRRLGGWELKSYAILHSRFREVLLLDADNAVVADPEYLFASREFAATGAIFWPDLPQRSHPQKRDIWRSCGLQIPREPEFESGQMVLDKARCWPALCLALWFNENSDFYYRHLHGDKETFHLAFRKLKQPYTLVRKPVRRLTGTMCQHDLAGRLLFQHRNTDKWNLFLHNETVRGFRFEHECRAAVAELQKLWPGNLPAALRKKLRRSSRVTRSPRIQAVMISCEPRNELREQTLAHLATTDWNDAPLIQMDDQQDGSPVQRQLRSTFQVLKAALERRPDYILFLEDDLQFNRHLRHNLLRWTPLRSRLLALASLYNPGIRELQCDVEHSLRIMHPRSVYGSQAFLLSRPTTGYLLENWHQGGSGQDLKIARLVGRRRQPIFYHAPSLVQHVGRRSIWGGQFHQARDFDPEWKAR
ncbi:MAG: glycosyltransferase family 9 protein [Verrucomicrobiota bacterium]